MSGWPFIEAVSLIVNLGDSAPGDVKDRTARNLNPTQSLPDKRDKVWYNRTEEYYTAMKRTTHNIETSTNIMLSDKRVH